MFGIFGNQKHVFSTLDLEEKKTDFFSFCADIDIFDLGQEGKG